MLLGIASHMLWLWMKKSKHLIHGQSTPPPTEDKHTLKENRGVSAQACGVQKHGLQDEDNGSSLRCTYSVLEPVQASSGHVWPPFFQRPKLLLITVGQEGSTLLFHLAVSLFQNKVIHLGSVPPQRCDFRLWWKVPLYADLFYGVLICVSTLQS